MKVALLSDCYLPRLGGIEVQVHDLAARLVERGHEVQVFTATPGNHGERYGATEVVDGITVHRMALRLPWDLPVNPLAPLTMRARLAGFDVAHVHMGVVSPFAVDSAFLTMRLGLPTAMTWHCMLDRFAPVVSALGVVRRWAARGMAMSAVSGVAAAPLRRILGPSHEVAVLPNGIDVDTWRAKKRPASDGTVRIVTAMRLATRKRPLPLIKVVRRARELVPTDIPMHLEILGEGPDRAKVERFVADHGMAGWVSLPGRVNREELRSRYAAADVYMSPGKLESFGIAALEARTAGLPVVARHGSGIGEFVTDGVNGYLAGDDDEMAAALARLVAQPQLRTGMTAHNMDHRPTQDWATVAASAEAEYERAVGAMGVIGNHGAPVSGREVVEQAALWVVGVDGEPPADEMVSFRLDHGEDPESGLRSRGFEPLAADHVVGQAVPHVLRLVYRVRRADGIPQPAVIHPAVDARLVRVPGEVPVAYQRLAAYAVVHSARGILLSQASGRTNAPGSWGLCGGGVDPGELPEEALHREVWEETSQKITVTGLAQISTRHWIGRAPYGRLEDFHAVRIIYRATCPEPADPLVLDADGTTAASAWVPADDVPGLPLTPGWRDIVLPLLDVRH